MDSYSRPRVERRADSVELWCLDVLLVEPDAGTRDTVVDLLRGVGHRVHAVADSMQALLTARAHYIDLVIANVDGPARDGYSIVSRVRSLCPEAHAILCCEVPSIEDAVAATKARAEYLIKPLLSRNLLRPVAAVARSREQRAEHVAARAEAHAIVGRSPLILNLIDESGTMAAADGPILITGEHGAGKNLLARTVHAGSRRNERPMIEVDCAAAEPPVIAEELFGDGGAVRRASGATLLLDHVEALSPVAQAALLRDLEGGELDGSIESGARVIAITSHDLQELVAAGQFREELACRLLELHLVVPPLRQHRDDLPALVEHFCFELVGETGVLPRFAPEVWATLAAARFPGNVRELELVVRHALAFHSVGDVQMEHLPARFREGWREGETRAQAVAPLVEAVNAFEHEYLQQALIVTNGNRTRAASMLGISRKGLWAKLRRFREQKPRPVTVDWRR